MQLQLLLSTYFLTSCEVVFETVVLKMITYIRIQIGAGELVKLITTDNVS